MKKFWVNDKEYLANSGWYECSQDQIVNALMLQQTFQAEGDKVKQAHYRLGMLRIICNAPGELLKQLTGKQIQRLLRLTDWTLTARIEHKPFEGFTFEGTYYYLPNDNMANTTSIELVMGNIFYLQFAHPDHPNKDAVLKLVATLCRPQRTDLDTFRKLKIGTATCAKSTTQ